MYEFINIILYIFMYKLHVHKCAYTHVVYLPLNYDSLINILVIKLVTMVN
jgi:hypothetical protein